MMNPSSAIFLLTIGIVSADVWSNFNPVEPQAEWKCTNNYDESIEIDIANGDQLKVNNAQIDLLYRQQYEQMDITYGTPIPCYDYKKYVAVTGEESEWTCTNIETNEQFHGVNANAVKKPTINPRKGHYGNNSPQVKGHGPRQPKTMNACQEQRKHRESQQ